VLVGNNWSRRCIILRGIKQGKRDRPLVKKVRALVSADCVFEKEKICPNPESTHGGGGCSETGVRGEGFRTDRPLLLGAGKRAVQ